MYVTSFSVFHTTEATVSIGLKHVLRMATSILQNQMSMLRSRACQISLSFHPNSSKEEIVFVECSHFRNTQVYCCFLWGTSIKCCIHFLRQISFFVEHDFLCMLLPLLFFQIKYHLNTRLLSDCLVFRSPLQSVV